MTKGSNDSKMTFELLEFDHLVIYERAQMTLNPKNG